MWYMHANRGQKAAPRSSTDSTRRSGHLTTIERRHLAPSIHKVNQIPRALLISATTASLDVALTSISMFSPV